LYFVKKKKKMEHYQVAIVGSGPAGFTAAIYSSRALLSTVLFEGMQPGGQLTITTEVENFPGFPDGVQGPELMELFRRQAQKFGTVTLFETVKKVDFNVRPFHLWTDAEKEYTADAVIIATGASAKRLRAKGEDEYWGFGISACATCDGFFYKNQKVYVIGGGDSAMEEAMYLTHFASSVTIIHRRKEFRASKIMVKRAQENPKIDFLLDSVVEEFLGETKMGIKKLTHIRVRNVVTNEEQILPADGVFYAIGHTPNTEIFKPFIETDANGYIITKNKSTYTNIPGVFACGDCQDPTYRQAVSAAGSGCMAAIDAERWLSEYYAEQK
jgi:thioredoxin reductase (NADPH)